MVLRRLLAAAVIVLAAASCAAAAEIPAPVLAAYLKVQTDLAGDQLQPAVENAKALSAEAAKAGESAGKVRGAADKLAEAKDLDAARKAFGDLSDAVIALAGVKSPGGDVKLAYCPMVKKSWLQKGEKIQNPYYGKAMLECGEIKK